MPFKQNSAQNSSNSRPISKKEHRKISRRKFLKGTVGATLLGGTGLYFESKSAYRLGVNHHDLVLPRFDADGFKIAHLTDFHANNKAKADRAIQAIELAMLEKPDLVVITGDFVDGSQDSVLDQLRRVVRHLSNFDCPVVSVLGNHDYWVPAPRKVFDILESGNMKLLRNELFEVGGVKIAGIDDAIAGRAKHHFVGLAGDKNVVALLHEPDFVKDVDDRASLMLSGHSHGGQICLPGGWHLHTPFGARKYIQGFYPNAKVPLFVSRGVGTIGIDSRTFCPPEVAILTLKSS